MRAFLLIGIILSVCLLVHRNLKLKGLQDSILLRFFKLIKKVNKNWGIILKFKT